MNDNQKEKNNSSLGSLCDSILNWKMELGKEAEDLLKENGMLAKYSEDVKKFANMFGNEDPLRWKKMVGENTEDLLKENGMLAKYSEDAKIMATMFGTRIEDALHWKKMFGVNDEDIFKKGKSMLDKYSEDAKKFTTMFGKNPENMKKFYDSALPTQNLFETSQLTDSFLERKAPELPYIPANPMKPVINRLNESIMLQKEEIDLLKKKNQDDNEYFKNQLSAKNEEIELIKGQINDEIIKRKKDEKKWKHQILLQWIMIILTLIMVIFR